MSLDEMPTRSAPPQPTQPSVPQMTGAQKAAILLLRLGSERSAILRNRPSGRVSHRSITNGANSSQSTSVYVIMQTATSSSTEFTFQCHTKSGTFHRYQGRPTSMAIEIAAKSPLAIRGIKEELKQRLNELHGAGRNEDLGRSVRQSLYLTALATAAGFLGLLMSAPLLRWTDVPPAMRGEVHAYLSALALALDVSPRTVQRALEALVARQVDVVAVGALRCGRPRGPARRMRGRG